MAGKQSTKATFTGLTNGEQRLEFALGNISLGNGVYAISIQTSDKKVYTQKFMIR